MELETSFAYNPQDEAADGVVLMAIKFVQIQV